MIKRINKRLSEWCACIECGTKRWVQLRSGQPQSKRCHICRNKYLLRIRKVSRGKDHWHWKGGRSFTKSGYVEVWVSPEHPFSAMRNKDGYVYEHRLVIANSLGRCLLTTEHIHHKNGKKDDNRVRNLQLLSQSDHMRKPWRELERLRKEVCCLRQKLRKAYAS